ncbi:hypothetical protein XENTR_v10014935 [Xenopus tropicalis]|nr:hypothetical protein XENTR_v10014935 [Xenopus tropicalis]
MKMYPVFLLTLFTMSVTMYVHKLDADFIDFVFTHISGRAYALKGTFSLINMFRKGHTLIIIYIFYSICRDIIIFFYCLVCMFSYVSFYSAICVRCPAHFLQYFKGILLSE